MKINSPVGLGGSGKSLKNAAPILFNWGQLADAPFTADAGNICLELSTKFLLKMFI